MTLFYAPRTAPRDPGQPGELLPWRLGVTATRKTGGAVERNRQKRRLKEFFRIHQVQIPDGWDYVINTTQALNHAKPAELERDLAKVLAPVGFRRVSAAPGASLAPQSDESPPRTQPETPGAGS